MEVIGKRRSLETIITIINNAKKEIVIITPFLKITDSITSSLISKSNDGVEITLICRYENISVAQKELLKRIPRLQLYNNHFLHSKLYLNEKQCLITSANFYCSTINKNWEFGMFLSLENNKEAIRDIRNELNGVSLQSLENHKRTRNQNITR